MINELLTPDRINITDSVLDWEQAITMAAQPLIKDGSITEVYIEGMLANVRRYGPYIVLTDRFALPHANGIGCVSRVALSLLQVKEPVDVLGRTVNIFMVLAAPDNNSHISALCALMELLRNEKNITTLAEGSWEEIVELISKT